MSGKKAIIFSRTPWYEPPRMRHQFTRMLLEMNYKIIYIEVLFFKKKSKSYNHNENFKIISIRDLIHHQLKRFSFLVYLNQLYFKLQIKFHSADLNNDAIFINFNYDYSFLKKLFPNSNHITVLNDDFIEMAKPWMKKQSEKLLKQTCFNSNLILSMSYSINEKAQSFSKNAKLFLPWSEKLYKKPPIKNNRNVILYFGFINRLDLDLVIKIAKFGLNIRFVGPVEGNGIKAKSLLCNYKNIEFCDKVDSIEELNLDDVYCSVAFYDINYPGVKATTASNRMFRLLSFGIPLVYPEMPNLIKAPKNVIRKCKNYKEYIDAFKYFSKNFDLIQPEINNFLKGNNYSDRKKQIEFLFNNL